MFEESYCLQLCAGSESQRSQLRNCGSLIVMSLWKKMNCTPRWPGGEKSHQSGCGQIIFKMSDVIYDKLQLFPCVVDVENTIHCSKLIFELS